ncbi:hypothetical protein ACN4EK_19000 [Pantanalinema rosaneae CENA516]
MRLAGDLEQAQQVLQRSLDLAKAVNSPQEESATLLSVGNLAQSRSTSNGTQAAIADYQPAANLAPNAITNVQAQMINSKLFCRTQGHSDQTAIAMILYKPLIDKNRLAD